LRGYVAVSTTAFRLVLYVATVAVVGVMLRSMQNLVQARLRVSSGWSWWLVLTGAFALGLYRVSGRWTGGSSFRSQVRRDLERGELAVQTILVVDAIEVAEQEDEGPGYFLHTQDGRTALFAGQYLERYRLRGFPWSAFELLEAPESGLFLGLKKLGDRLTPSVRRAPFRWDEFKRFGLASRKYCWLDVDFGRLKRGVAEHGVDQSPEAD
jgi:hypothetical protein